MSNSGAGKVARPQNPCEENMIGPEGISEKIGSDIFRLESAVHMAEEIREILVGDRYAVEAGDTKRSNEVNIYDALSRERGLIIELLDNLEAIKGLM